MWCDNCFLIFPLRAGAMILGTILALYEAGGGIFLFKYGDFYFTLYNIREAEIYAGFSMLQAGVVVLGIIAFSARSYIISRMVFVLYPIIILLAAIRAGLMMWSFNHYSWRFIWSCNNGGVKWTDEYENELYKVLPESEFTKIPPRLCRYDVQSISAALAVLLITDFVLMCYYYFLMWRFNVKIQHYPYQKNEFVYPT